MSTWRNGRRIELKIRRLNNHAGSTPAVLTNLIEWRNKTRRCHYSTTSEQKPSSKVGHRRCRAGVQSEILCLDHSSLSTPQCSTGGRSQSRRFLRGAGKIMRKCGATRQMRFPVIQIRRHSKSEQKPLNLMGPTCVAAVKCGSVRNDKHGSVKQHESRVLKRPGSTTFPNWEIKARGGISTGDCRLLSTRLTKYCLMPKGISGESTASMESARFLILSGGVEMVPRNRVNIHGLGVLIGAENSRQHSKFWIPNDAGVPTGPLN